MRLTVTEHHSFFIHFEAIMQWKRSYHSFAMTFCNDLPRQQWSLLNHFRTEQGHCGACRRKWRLTDTDLCPCGETETMSHIVESCPLTKLNGGLSRLHSADEDAVSWLTNYGKWHAYEKKKKNDVLKPFLYCNNMNLTVLFITIFSHLLTLFLKTSHFSYITFCCWLMKYSLKCSDVVKGKISRPRSGPSRPRQRPRP